MKKMFIVVLIFLPSVILAIGNNWYVSTASSGNASGNSWANKTKFSTFNWGTVQPGDTIYLDGGTDSVVYDVNQYEISTHGTVALPITITKGIDAGHNGKAVFRNTSQNYIGMELADITNTIFYNLEWKGMMSATGETWLLDFGGNNIKNVTFLYCTFILNYSCGVGTNSGASSDNIKFLYCNSYNNLDTGTNSSADQFWLGGPNHKNWEFAYCNIINTNPKTGATVAGTHRDLMQCEWNWGRGGTFKIHHNFFDDRSAGAAGACIESEHLEGNWLIYNNVFKTNSTGANNTGHFSTLSLTANYGAVGTNSIEVYNNTFYCTTRWGRSPSFLGWDNLTFKNNIVYLPNPNNTWFIMAIDSYTWNHNIDSDYNQFYNINSNYIANESGTDFTWTQWRSAGYDAHSTLNTDIPDFSNANGLNGVDYALITNSDGIDDGTTIALVTDDYSGANRPQGSAYDLGAFEFAGNNNGDTTPPNLQGALLLSSTTLVLNFSEALNSSTAQNKNNYSISNGIIVTSAVLSGTQVTLTTSAHINGSYTVAVSNITDLAGNSINPENNTANYNYTEVDITPPELLSASLLDSANLGILFSEPMESSSAIDISNYSISNGISVLNASISADKKNVTLNTTSHTAGLQYTLTVLNLKDLSGNLISTQNNSINYEFINPINYNLKLSIFNVNASGWYLEYSPDKTVDGVIGNGSRWRGATAMPDTINYSLNDIQIINIVKLSFFRGDLGRIYNYSILVSSDSSSWTQVRDNIPSQPQQWSVEEVEPIEAKYIRIILLSCSETIYAGIWEAEFWGQLKITTNNEGDNEDLIPLEFSLKQNYPNPFNPSTRISWRSPVSSWQTIKIYDVLGNEVATLIDEYKSVGSYEVEFNAANLSSGVYIYRLQAEEFTETKKMILMK